MPPVPPPVSTTEMGFDQTIAIDWSGAKGKTQKGIAVALCERRDEGVHHVSLIVPPEGALWSRSSLLIWLQHHLSQHRALVGFDFSFSLPYVDYDDYLPGTALRARSVFDLWHEIEGLCKNAPNYEGHNFVERHSDCFLQTSGRVGDLFVQYGPRLRVCEEECMLQGHGRAESNFHLIGPTQVGLSSFSGMRVLKQLCRTSNVCVWPFDLPAKQQSVIVEMYTRLFLTMAGVGRQKIRSRNDLDRSLDALRAKMSPSMVAMKNNDITVFDDHVSDALVSAAGMMMLADQSKVWTPAKLSDKVRKTEGWTFGVL